MRKERLEEFNDWWFTGAVPEELIHTYKRPLFDSLAVRLHKRPIISITGLRRTGKTTLLFQLIQKLLEDGEEKANILYFNFDEYVESLDELFDSYRELYKKNFRDAKVYLFLDEIQKVDNWENQIKKYYDLYPKLKFVLSGSESLFIRAKTKEALAGRIESFILKPLSFSEFIGIKGEKNIPEARIKQLFLDYLETGGFPEMAGKNKPEIKDYVKSIVLDKVIFKDIVKLFGIKDTDTIRQLIEIIAANPGMYLDYQSLAQQLGKDRRLIKNYILLLNESFLIKVLGNYRKGAAVSLRKLKKVYPADSSIIIAFKPAIDDQFLGKIVESVVVNSLHSESFWKNSHEIDIVNDGIPVEVKYQNTIVSKDFDGLRQFMRRFSVKKSILITKNEEKTAKAPEGQIKLIPAWKFLLSLAKKN